MPTPTHLQRLHVVLVDPRNPLNIGAAARAMSNFGIQSLRLVNPYDVAFREARSARGGATVLARAQQFATVAEAIADCTLVVGTSDVRHRELQHPVRRLETGAVLIRKHLASGSVALLFGSEKFGLSNHDLSHCHWLLSIPTDDASASMNLGQAVAVCMYELARNAKAARQPATSGKTAPSARAAEVERITSVLLESLRVSGYLKPRSGAATEEKIRRIVRRMKLNADDAEVLLGMLRQMLWKMREGEGTDGTRGV